MVTSLLHQLTDNESSNSSTNDHDDNRNINNYDDSNNNNRGILNLLRDRLGVRGSFDDNENHNKIIEAEYQL